MKNKWLQTSNGIICKKVEDVKDEVRNQLTAIHDGKDIPEATINKLNKQKLIEARNDTWFSLKKGPNYAPKRVKPETDLTRELLQSGEWLKREFKPYNFNALGQPTEGGHLHPLLKVRTQSVISS